jgi:hypothetical protein
MQLNLLAFDSLRLVDSLIARLHVDDSQHYYRKVLDGFQKSRLIRLSGFVEYGFSSSVFEFLRVFSTREAKLKQIKIACPAMLIATPQFII